MDENEQVIIVSLNANTTDPSEAAKVVETFSRLLVGLALDGVNIHMGVSAYEPEDEDYEYEDLEEGESDG